MGLRMDWRPARPGGTGQGAGWLSPAGRIPGALPVGDERCTIRACSQGFGPGRPLQRAALAIRGVILSRKLRHVLWETARLFSPRNLLRVTWAMRPLTVWPLRLVALPWYVAITWRTRRRVACDSSSTSTIGPFPQAVPRPPRTVLLSLRRRARRAVSLVGLPGADDRQRLAGDSRPRQGPAVLRVPRLLDRRVLRLLVDVQHEAAALRPAGLPGAGDPDGLFSPGLDRAGRGGRAARHADRDQHLPGRGSGHAGGLAAG